MANNKKSFMFYCDWQETFSALPNEKAGELVKHLLAYVNDENPSTDDLLINVVFANIKQTLKRDLKKWQQKSEQNRANANKRWDANACERIKPDANYADRDRVIDIDSYIIEISKSEIYLEGFYRTYRLESGSAHKLLELFKQHLKMNPKQHANFTEFRNHFNNWMQKKESNKQLEKYMLIPMFKKNR